MIRSDFDTLLNLGWVACADGYAVNIDNVGQRVPSIPPETRPPAGIHDDALRGAPIWTVTIRCKDQIVRWVGSDSDKKTMEEVMNKINKKVGHV